MATVTRELSVFRESLDQEVFVAFHKSSEYGGDRFGSWRKRLCKYLDATLPGESARFNSRMGRLLSSARLGETNADRFWRNRGSSADAFLESLMDDLNSGSYEAPELATTVLPIVEAVTKPDRLSRVFIVHGHDSSLQQEVARFVERLGLQSVILQEQASGGKTIIEMIEAHTDVGFAIVLYTPDDVGASERDAKNRTLKPRARQNVVFEHGYVMAKLSRERVTYLVSDESIELPSDIGGMLYARGDWMLRVALEMQRIDPTVDLNRLGS